MALLAYKLLGCSVFSINKKLNVSILKIRLTLQPCLSSINYNLSKPQELSFLNILFFRYTFNL